MIHSAIRSRLVAGLLWTATAGLLSTPSATAGQLPSTARPRNGTSPPRSTIVDGGEKRRGCSTADTNHAGDASCGCLTRAPGFWGTHPEMAMAYLDSPFQVCGVTLDTVNAGFTTSVTEALCVGATERAILGSDLAQLVRQCTAASLNVVASSRLGGQCGSPHAHPYIDRFLANCCAAESVCTGWAKYTERNEPWTIQQCIAGLDLFNNAYPDSLELPTAAGPRDPRLCAAAMDNGLVVTPIP